MQFVDPEKEFPLAPPELPVADEVMTGLRHLSSLLILGEPWTSKREVENMDGTIVSTSQIHRRKSFPYQGEIWDRGCNFSLSSAELTERAARGNPHDVSELWRYENVLVINNDFMQRGFCIIPGEDHMATGVDGEIRFPDGMPIFFNPAIDRKRLLDLENDLYARLNDDNSIFDGKTRPTRALTAEEVREFFDTVLLDEENADLLAIQDAHMARVKASASKA